ncbi:MAG: radical SAM protein [Candidatus Odinarchaeia archaeon]
MKREIKRTKGNSYVIGDLPEGCEHCIEGSKIVVFMTNKCDRKCYYCPISENKRKSSDIFVDEIRLTSDADILREAKMINAKGAGFTGGDPLLVFNKTIKYIKLLKEEFGSQFHIHLYTTSHTLNNEKIHKLSEAGLDEIRFHTETLDSKKIDSVIKAGINLGWEIPAIPGTAKDIIELIEFLEKHNVKFININELEFSETNALELKKRGFKLKENSIAAVEGSEETAINVLKWAEKNTNTIKIHYCPSSLKDGVQLRNRFMRRAKNVKKEYEEMDEEGLLIKGVFYLKNKEKCLELKEALNKEYEVPERLIEIDLERSEVYSAWYIVKELSQEMKKREIKTKIVKCFPTDDRFVVYSQEVS